MRRTLVVILFAAAMAGACTPHHYSLSLEATPVPVASTADTPAPADTSAVASTDPSATFDPASPFMPAGETFSIQMPAKPTFSKITAKTPAGDLPISSWSCEDASHRQFNVSHATFATGALGTTTDKGVFDGAVEQIASQSKTKVKSQSEVTLGSHVGRAFVLTGGDVSLHGEIFLVRNDLFMIYAGVPADGSGDAAVAPFLASFKLP